MKKIHEIPEEGLNALKEENIKLRLELMTVIMGYENELLSCKREDISSFSKGCLERYFSLSKEMKD